ncbi:MAG: hypothetical protein HY721_03570 [Planctomycetes bacterium]|nr:hypothetical protein [Planctomycetota bacterium]
MALRVSAGILFGSFGAVAALLAPCRGQEPRELAPTPKAEPHVAHKWTSKAGLNYTWVLPKGYGPEKPRSMTVILHGTGLDYRWGHANNRPGLFRPDDVVVSVDGTSPGAGGTRLFLGEPKDARLFHELLDELRGLFAVRSVFLYGHSQGSFFAVYFAGEHPEDVAGVVAHASGSWTWSKTGKPAHKVAIAFLHGTADPVVPYRQSAGARDHYVKAGFPLVHLRRLPLYNHWPNAVRANEALAWCEGMTTGDPAAALAAAREILRPKGLDEYQWECPVGYSAARDVLRRLEGKGSRPFAKTPQAIAAAAKAESARIDKAAQAHAAKVRSSLGGAKRLALDGKPWLGHLVSLREDFRGVEAMEKLAAALGHDKLLEAHGAAAGRILNAWYREGAKPADVFRTVVAELPGAFLYEGFPPELSKKMAEWKAQAAALGLSEKDLKAYAAVEAWEKGWKDGLAEYRGLWKAWK